MTKIERRSPISNPMSAPAVTAQTIAKALVPSAPVRDVKGALNRPAAMPAELSASSANVGTALNMMSSARTAFGPQFNFVKMDEPSAVATTLSSLLLVKSKLTEHTLHGFLPRLTFKDELGRANTRMIRTYDGIPIFGAEVIVHMNADGKPASITGKKLPNDLKVDTSPTIEPAAAMETAQKAFAKAVEGSDGAKLVIAKTPDGAFHLAWHIALANYGDDPGKAHYFIDAHSGAVLPLGFVEHQGTRKRTDGGAPALPPKPPQGPPPPAVGEGTAAEGTGDSVYEGKVKLTTTKVGNLYYLRDPKNHNSETRDAHNGRGGPDENENTIITDNNNVWGEAGDDPRARDGIDAQWVAGEYLRYLKETFGRDSIDDAGIRLISNVHVRVKMANAYWNGGTMNYGDGDDGDNLTQVDADTGGHEITHGLTQHTCNLTYRGESGALNEAFSDILGACGFSWFLRGHNDNGTKRDWNLFEDSFTPKDPNDALRYMDDPARDGHSRDNYSKRYTGEGDNGGVHINSGIANNLFYLLAAGGTNKTSGMLVPNGVGMEKALRIYYRAHTVYFTPDTDFVDARAALIKAATDLFGADAAEVKVVKQAAEAVGVTETTPHATPTEEPEGESLLVA